MSKKTWKFISVLAGIVAVIGLVSFLGGVRSVNLGAFAFPAVISAASFLVYQKK